MLYCGQHIRFGFYLHFLQHPNFCGIGEIFNQITIFFPFELTHQAVRSHTLACYTFGCSQAVACGDIELDQLLHLSQPWCQHI